jgi:hypothetical protein
MALSVFLPLVKVEVATLFYANNILSKWHEPLACTYVRLSDRAGSCKQMIVLMFDISPKLKPAVI